MTLRYEGMRFISEKQVIILDIGSAYTKFGLSGESSPRGIIKTEVKCPETKEIRKILSYQDANDLYQLLVEFLHLIFFKHTAISPKDIKVVILESLLTLTVFRDTLAKVMFHHFEVGSLMILPTHLVAMNALGTDIGLIMDVGYEEAVLIPIYGGVPILKAWQALPLAGRAVHESVAKDMKDALPDLDLTEKIIEDIKVRTCFVTTYERSITLETENAPKPPPSVKYQGVKTFLIPGTVRENAFEVLWARDNDNLSIPTMILDALIKCPVDTRKPLAENILLVGGTVMTPGFTSRLKSELLNLVNSDLYNDKLKVRTFKFHKAPSKPNYTTWLGGAIFGIADLPSRCITKEKYLEHNRIPDWVCFLDNKKEDSSNSV